MLISRTKILLGKHTISISNRFTWRW